MPLRDYQEFAVESIFGYFADHEGNPICAMPTGTGKSHVIAEFLRRALRQYPGTRAMMATHVKELIDQNMQRLLYHWPTAPAGVYSAGLGRKEAHAPVTFAGIASIHRKADIFGHVDLMLIDECHLVSQKATTSYQRFIADLRKHNPHLKVIGFSATPYRLGHGMLTEPGGIFTDLCVDLTSRDSFNWLVSQGWLAPLVPKKTRAELDVQGVRLQGGEFVQADLQRAVDKDFLTYAALKEARELAADRRHWLVFAAGVDHAEHVASALNDMGVSAVVVHAGLSNEERDRRIVAFRRGEVRAMVNNNVLTTGFDFPEIDCIVMLRPTASPGLWVQMLGRGTRPADGKTNCLVLDFAGNTQRLGPINDPVLPRRKGTKGAGVAPVRLCEHCLTYNHASARVCVECGFEFPRSIKLMAEASTAALIAGALPVIENFKVDSVVYRLHKKDGRPDSMRVDYYCGLRRFSEYICLDHPGYAGRVARQWWEFRCPFGVPPSVHDGMTAVKHLRSPMEIRVALKKQYPEICGYIFNGDPK
jgi:DNA repair protein RadD